MNTKFRQGDVVIVDMGEWHLLGVVRHSCKKCRGCIVEHEYNLRRNECEGYWFDFKMLTKIEGRL